MKKALLLFGMALACVQVYAQGLPLRQGDTFTFGFVNLPYQRDGNLNNAATASFFLSGDLLEPGERLQVELFEDDPDDAADITAWSEGPSDRVRLGAGDPFWADRQGAIRLTMLSGMVELSSMTFEVNQGGLIYAQTVFVPEPSLPLLLGLGSLLAFWRFKRQRR